jgi:hypothetical protein
MNIALQACGRICIGAVIALWISLLRERRTAGVWSVSRKGGGQRDRMTAERGGEGENGRGPERESGREAKARGAVGASEVVHPVEASVLSTSSYQ